MVNGQTLSDLEKIDSLAARFYNGVSFDDGQWKDAEKIKPYFFTDARIVSNFGVTPQVTTIEQYIASVRSNISKQGIIAVVEKEIYNQTDVFGKVAQRLSTYEIRFSFREKNELVRRGINMMQLINDGCTWKINSIVWDRESDQLKIPHSTNASNSLGITHRLLEMKCTQHQHRPLILNSQ